MSKDASIERFLAGRRIALVGASTHDKDFSRVVLRELVRHGYDVVPVRPGVDAIEGRAAYARVQDVPGGLDGVLVMTPPEESPRVVRDCAVAGVKRVWLHRGVGRGAVSDGAVAECRAAGIDAVVGECPLMFLANPEAKPLHRAHGFARRLAGTYPGAEVPRRSAASRALTLLVHGAVAWSLCTATMVVAGRLLSPGAAAAAKLVVMSSLFAAAAAVYARYFGAASPLRAAGALVVVALALDAISVAPWGAGALTSVVNTWLPLGFAFVAAAVAGALAQPHRHLPLASAPRT